jgi:two-component system chemotaxis sensor kinase CheA
MAQDAGPDAAAGSLTASVNRLVQQMAEDLGKRVEGQVALERLGELPAATQDLVREITVQLTRNAVVHGVETPSEREAQGKPAQGLVAVQLQKQDDGWHLSVRDDGQGISPARVRARLLSLGWYNAEQLESFSERQIVEQIFKPGFSTATEVSVHAGRGAGLDVVGANVRRLGARVRLTSTPGACTEFRLRFDA